MTEIGIRAFHMPMSSTTTANTRGKRKSGGDRYADGDELGLSVASGGAAPAAKKRRDSNNRQTTTAADVNVRATRSNAPEDADGDFVFKRGSRKTRATAAAITQTTTMSNPPQIQAVSQPAPKAPIATQNRPHQENTVSLAALPTPHRQGRRAALATQAAGPEPSQPTQPRTIRKPTNGTRTPHAAKVRRSPRMQEDGGKNGSESKIVSLRPEEKTPMLRKQKHNTVKPAEGGNRRSSMGMRGRRASSLSNGALAAPHPDVKSEDFYKHIDAGMAEVPRMQQLLAWCGRRALTETRAKKDIYAEARTIQEEILRDLTEKKISVSWFRAIDPDASTTAVKKANPRNEDHLRKIEKLEEELRLLNEETEMWTQLEDVKPTDIPSRTYDNRNLANNFDQSLLRSEDISAIASLDDAISTVQNTQDLLSRTKSSMEYRIDDLVDNLHKMGQFGKTATAVADDILAKAAVMLEVRQEATRRAAGTKELPLQEILRSISHLDPGR